MKWACLDQPTLKHCKDTIFSCLRQIPSLFFRFFQHIRKIGALLLRYFPKTLYFCA